MPEIVSTKTFDTATTLTGATGQPKSPGGPSSNVGSDHPPSVWDHLPVPWGTVGNSTNEQMRSFFIRLGLDGAATSGRDILCQKYNELRQKIHKAAGDAAVEAWLQERKYCFK